MVIIDEENYLAHYGILRRSGRYPWGSSSNVGTRHQSFLDTVAELKASGMTEKQIADTFEISTTELRAAKSIAKNERRQSAIAQAQRLKDKGYSNVAIGERMGIGESQVRNLLAPGAKDKADVLTQTADVLRKNADEKRYLDVGSGVENYLDVSDTKLNTAVAMLKEEGYNVYYLRVQQLGTGKETTVRVLTPPDVTYKELAENQGQLKQIQNWSEDGGRTNFGIKEPLPLAADRIKINYAEDGGAEADGVLYVRPGVEDVSLGGSRYAQVRVAVEGGLYMKGMAMYKHDLPDGVDVVFNTNKTKDTPFNKVLKKMKDDPDNPFGAEIRRQIQDENENVTSVMNLLSEEGDWNKWSRTISAQALSKQSPTLAKQQLDLAYQRRKAEYDEIMALDNPTVRKKLLEDFAEGADASAVHLKAAAMPRQRWQVILPIKELSDTEVYAPNFKDGEDVVLIRYPHGGTFEIPQLKVNNRHRTAKESLGDARDAIGINPKVAERLSGADFDGDTVLVIPNNSGKFKSTAALKDLQGFDPRASFPAYEGMPKMKSSTKQREMGDVSNLITDMTIKNASTSELARAVKHSMVVIDAEKHDLNYKESARVHGIKQLKEKYQGGPRAGADTLISKSGANATVRVNERKPRPYAEGGPIDPKTGKRVYVETGVEYTKTTTKKDGTQVTTPVKRTSKVARLDLVDDAHELSSGTRMESIYADHSNRMKSLANQARLDTLATPRLKYSPSAKKVYAKEVSELNAGVALAKRNRPRERQAQVLANAIVKQKRNADPHMKPEELKRVKSQALLEARRRVGAEKPLIKLTTRHWEAIQAGAISDSKLREILDASDMDVVKKFATPKSKPAVPPAKVARIQALLDSGLTRAQVADKFGIPLGTMDEALYGENGKG